MSKERARRRAAREHEAAIRAAGRAEAQARLERRRNRAARVRRVLPRRTRHARPTGSLARRRRVETSLVLALLVVLNVLAWVVSPDPAVRLGALVVSLLVAPVLVTLLVPRR